MRTISVIGCGQIGSAVLRGLETLEDWQPGKVLTRRARPGAVDHTQDVGDFLSHPADLIVDTAGPDALRAIGLRALAVAPVWSVGAVAMADPAFRSQVADARHGLRLFACGMANMPLSARRLHITMRGPEIGHDWTGPLAQAIPLWPDRLNTAVAAALNGPGLEATELTMERGGPDAPHEIEAEAEMAGIRWHRSIRFERRPDVPHPVAQMLLSELARASRPWQGV